jgi:pimeloyl-ACP methyl ester carboxylesterase
MQPFAKKKLLIAVCVIAVAVLAGLAYIADKPSYVPPADDWEALIRQQGVVHENLFITAPKARLEADLFIPKDGSERKSAVVFITGSGDSLYQNYADGLIEAYVLDIFLPRDFAVLLVNKRGMGESSGSWLNNDFQGRADDIYAAVQQLMAREDIDPEHVGVMGHSQGGWIANLVAAQHDDVAFFVSLAGPTTSVATQMQDTYRNVFACEGSQGEELERRTAKQLRLTRLGAAVGGIIPFGVIGFDAGIINYDPEDALRNARQPGLFVFGEFDLFVPPESSLDRIQGLFGTDVPGNLSFLITPQANHRFKVVTSRCPDPEDIERARFSPELSHALDNWLDQIVY